jgi:purine-nucleoside phosphorylase
MQDLYASVAEAARYLREAVTLKPRVAVILGTGFGGVSGRVHVAHRIGYNEIPHFPESTVEGHRGSLVFGTWGGCDVVVMEGRVHHYEGYTLQQITMPVRIMRELGAEILMVNSAAGGLNPLFRPEDVMVVTDHINMMGHSPLRGINDPGKYERFPDMSRPYDPDLIRLAGEAALDLKIPLRYGIYAAVTGPNLETRAETRMLRLLGADAVGMSTVPEVIVATQVGFRTLVFAGITNVNLPDAMEPVSVEQVIATAGRTQPKLTGILEAVLKKLSGQTDFLG